MWCAKVCSSGATFTLIIMSQAFSYLVATRLILLGAIYVQSHAMYRFDVLEVELDVALSVS